MLAVRDIYCWGKVGRLAGICRLFNAKSIFMQIVLFQTIQFIQIILIQLIQFSMSTDFVYIQLNVKTIQFSVSTVSM